MAPSRPNPGATRTQRIVGPDLKRSNRRGRAAPRQLQFEKCEACRNDKKKCLPVGRVYPEKCERCLAKGLLCSPPARSDNPRRRVGTDTSEAVDLGRDDMDLEEPRGVAPDGTEKAQPHTNPEAGAGKHPIDTAMTTATTSTSVAEAPKRNNTRLRSTLRSTSGDVDYPLVDFACPWYKFDPAKYFRCYKRYSLKRFSDVKQHITRRHTLAPLYCSRCWTSFEMDEDDEFTEHMAQGNCTGEPLPECLLPHESARLQQSDFGRTEDASRWYSVWDLLFPGHPRPASPYVADGIEEVLSLLHPTADLLRDALPSLLPLAGVYTTEEATNVLAMQIHHIYAQAFNENATPHGRRRLEFRHIELGNNSSEAAEPSTKADLNEPLNQ